MYDTTETPLTDIDFSRLVRLLIVHDLGEAIDGDVPAPKQAGISGKSKKERRDLLQFLGPLPEKIAGKILGLWDEYEEASTPEARMAKGLDKLETIMQHNQGKNPEDFDYGFNLGYGRNHTDYHPLFSGIRRILDGETAEKAAIRRNPDGHQT